MDVADCGKMAALVGVVEVGAFTPLPAGLAAGLASVAGAPTELLLDEEVTPELVALAPVPAGVIVMADG